MRVTLVSNGFPPAQIGGTEVYTAALARQLVARGHAVNVVCGGTWDEGGTYWCGVSTSHDNGVTLRRVNVNWTLAPDPFRYLFDNPAVAHYLRELWEADKPDVVQVTSCDRLSASVLPTARQLGIPVMLTLTDFWFLCPRTTLLRSDGKNCTRAATPWECTTCLSRDTKAYRWSKAVLPEPMVRRLLTTIGRTPVLSRQRGLRGMIGDMDGRQQCVREAFRCADHRVTASAFVRDRYYAAGFTEPIEVRPYGHEISWNATRTEATRSDVVRVGYIGHIDRHKGIHVLLEAVQQLPVALQQRVEVQIWGNASRAPEYVNELRAQAARLPHVRFCGTYPHEASGDVFGGFDVLVVPSLWYDFPLVVHEAFASGVPVVATRLGGMAESVTPEIDGLLFERGDVAGCAKILTRLLEEPTLLERLRRGIRAVRTMAQEAQDVEQRYRALRFAQRGVIS